MGSLIIIHVETADVIAIMVDVIVIILIIVDVVVIIVKIATIVIQIIIIEYQQGWMLFQIVKQMEEQDAFAEDTEDDVLLLKKGRKYVII